MGVAGEGVGEACAAGWGVVRRKLFSTCEIERRSAHQLGLGVQWGGTGEQGDSLVLAVCAGIAQGMAPDAKILVPPAYACHR